MHRLYMLSTNLTVLLLKGLSPIQHLVQEHAVGIYVCGFAGGLPPEQLRCPPVGGLVTPPKQQFSPLWPLYVKQVTCHITLPCFGTYCCALKHCTISNIALSCYVNSLLMVCYLRHVLLGCISPKLVLGGYQLLLSPVNSCDVYLVTNGDTHIFAKQWK